MFFYVQEKNMSEPKCRMNALRDALTGQVTIMTEEDRKAHAKFIKDYMADLNPEGMVQFHLARSIAHDAWRLNRAHAIEENILAYDFEGLTGKITAEHPEIHAAVAQALIFFRDPRKFAQLTMYEQRINRSFHKNLKAFMDIRKQRPQLKTMAA
jgi:hypothetical protein